VVVSTKDENYKKIAEAIREHGKINRKFKPNEMADGVKLVYDRGCEEGIDGYPDADEMRFPSGYSVSEVTE
jgi:hypothetical protein